MGGSVAARTGYRPHAPGDTAGSGLRMPYSVFNASLVSALQNVNGSNLPLAECVQFFYDRNVCTTQAPLPSGL